MKTAPEASKKILPPTPVEKNLNYKEGGLIRESVAVTLKVPNEAWLSALTCSLPYGPDDVRRVFEACNRDRAKTRLVLKLYASAGSTIPDDSPLKRLLS